MMVNKEEPGRKGQYNLARSIALGSKADKKIVRPARQGLSGGARKFIK